MPAVRLLVVVVVLVLLARAGRVAWRNRHLAVLVWGGVRPRHVAGSIVLLAVVLTVFGALLTFVPITQYGLGSLLGFDGNAVFAPVEEAVIRSGGAPLAEGGGGAPWWTTAGVLLFLGVLIVLLPWLAFGEEQLFRAGLERASPARQVWMALRFGLVHLIMLIPLAAALAVAVAGAWYGRVYIGAFRAAREAAEAEEAEDAEEAQRAAAAQTAGPAEKAGAVETAGPAETAGALSGGLADRPAGAEEPEDTAAIERLRRVTSAARREALLSSTIWHTTFNSVVIVTVAVSLVVNA